MQKKLKIGISIKKISTFKKISFYNNIIKQTFTLHISFYFTVIYLILLARRLKTFYKLFTPSTIISNLPIKLKTIVYSLVLVHWDSRTDEGFSTSVYRKNVAVSLFPRAYSYHPARKKWPHFIFLFIAP